MYSISQVGNAYVLNVKRLPRTLDNDLGHIWFKPCQHLNASKSVTDWVTHKPKQLKEISFAYAKLFPFTTFIVLSLSMDLYKMLQWVLLPRVGNGLRMNNVHART